MKKLFEYFTKENEYNIIIDDRGGRCGRYAVYNGVACVADCLSKKQALAVANEEFNYYLKELKVNK